MTRLHPPARVRLLALAAFVLALGTSHSRTAGLVVLSQLCYAPGDPMSTVLAVPAGTPVSPWFDVVTDQGAAVYTGQAVLHPNGWIGSDALGNTYLLDFTAAALGTGVYRIRSNGSVSAPFPVGSEVYDIASLRPLEFFRIQRADAYHSWMSLDGSSGWHGPDHLDDARQATRKDRGGGDRQLIQQDYLPLPGGWLDVSGGWSDAGDYNKYMGNTPWAAYLLLLTIEEYPQYWEVVDEDANGTSDLRDVARPALDWMLKMQHADGSTYERVFNGYTASFDGRPDLETDNVPGTADDRPLDTDRYADITAKAVYAWAAGYRVFGDPRYLDAARRAWIWASANQTRVKARVYGGGLYFGDVEIGLTLGALELHLAELAEDGSADPAYLTYAAGRVASHLAAGDWTDPSSWDFQESYVLMRYYGLASASDQARIVTQLRGRWDWAIGAQQANAYRMNDQWLYTGFGQNDLSASGASDALWVFARTGDRRYYDYAVNQMSWVFGRNPFAESWLASARVTEYTRVPHWRATAMHPIEGVVVPGATDDNGNGRPDYTDTGLWFYSEPTINQQAMFVRVMTQLHLAAGGALPPDAGTPPAVSIAAPGSGATVRGSIPIVATATDTDGVQSVGFRIDGGPLAPMTPSAAPNQWQGTFDTTGVIDGLHQIGVVAVDTTGAQSTAAVAVVVQNSAQPTLHVERVDVVLLTKGGKRVQARGDIVVYDAFGAPVAGALVTGHWEGAAGDTFSVTTDASGAAIDYSNATQLASGLVFTCVVDGVSLAGWVHDAPADRQTRGSATVP